MNKKNKISYGFVQRLVCGAYSRALVDLKLMPDQAFAYVQNEMELFYADDDCKVNVAFQTAIYMYGVRHGLPLSKSSTYACSMLSILSGIYNEFYSRAENKTDDLVFDDERLLGDVEAVKRIFLL